MEQLPDVMQRIHNISCSVQQLSVELQLVPIILKEVGATREQNQQISKTVDSLPRVCNDINKTCDDVQRIAVQLKSMPDTLQGTRDVCETILRGAGVDHMMPVLHLLQDTKSICDQIRGSVDSLDAVHEVCKETRSTCEHLPRLAADLTPLSNMLRDTWTACEKIQECVVTTLPSELNVMQQQSSVQREERRMLHKSVIERCVSIETAVSKSQPLTVDQYLQLNGVINRVLAEMQNPIPQPKMSFANAVVHVHKGRKCDEVTVDKFASPRGRPNAGLSLNEVIRQSDSSEQCTVAAPYPPMVTNLTGRLKKPPMIGSLVSYERPSTEESSRPTTKGTTPRRRPESQEQDLRPTYA